MGMNEPKLSGLEKASVLLMALGTSASTQVLKHLNEIEIEKLSSEIVKMHQMEPGLVQAVLDEFERMAASVASEAAGKEFASKVLEQVVGPEKAKDMVKKAARGGGSTHRFEFLWESETRQIVRMIKQEEPQIIALVLVNLPRDKAAEVLSELDENLKVQVAQIICSLGEVDPDVLVAIEEALEVRLSTMGAETSSIAAGPKALVEILNNAEQSTERLVLDSLNKSDPSIGEQVRSLMFIFEDILKLEDRSIQLVMREIDQEDLRAALKGADDKVKELVFKNMSERAAETLKEDLELAGNVKVKDIESAQQRIVFVIRRLLKSGEIALVEQQQEEQVA